MKAVVLVGGRGTRMHHITGGREKCLSLVRGQPFLAWQIAWLRNIGFTHCLFLGKSHGSEIPSLLSRWDLGSFEADFIPDSVPHQGTLHAVRSSLNRIGCEHPFVLVLGDVLLPSLNQVKLRGSSRRSWDQGDLGVHH